MRISPISFCSVIGDYLAFAEDRDIVVYE